MGWAGARNIVQRYALETGSAQGFGTGEKVAHLLQRRQEAGARAHRPRRWIVQFHAFALGDLRQRQPAARLEHPVNLAIERVLVSDVHRNTHRWRSYASQPPANPLLVRTILTAKQGQKRALFGFDLEAVDVEHEGGHEKQSKWVCQERGPAKQFQ